MKILDFLRKSSNNARAVQTGEKNAHPFEGSMNYIPLSTPDHRLYDSIREGVPLIDAAIEKIIRLTGGFNVVCTDRRMQLELDRFVSEVPVGATAKGLRQFICTYLDSLLTYGNAVGEIVMDSKGRGILALYNGDIKNIHLKRGKSPLDAVICTGNGFEMMPVSRPDLVMFTPLNPPAGEMRGVSLLRGLPFVSSILMGIFQSTSNNFDRVGNLRYAVTYKPGSSAVDRANAKEIADTLAEQWGEVMGAQKNGVIKDFVAVGDVDVKVIGADNQILNTEIPVRQMLEQIVAKLGIPPFMLGLHWSTTERMSTQQADILTSELESYRHLLEGVIRKICEMYLRTCGSGATVVVEWNDINLQDQAEEANVRLTNARALELEKKSGGEKSENN